MARTGKANRKGRSSGKFSRLDQKVFGPPEGEPWVWETTAMLESIAWRAMRHNTRKLIDFLLIEHRAHAGRENGNLVATYDQLATYGLTRQRIRAAIEEAEALGLIRANRPGMRRANKYRLTFIAAADRTPPTNEWKGITETHVRDWHDELNHREAGKRSRREKQFSGSRTRTELVHEHAPDSRAAPNTINAKPQKTDNSPEAI